MKNSFGSGCALLLLVLLAAGPAASRAQAQAAGGGAGAAPKVNLALVASPSSSYVSGDTTVAALNDGYAPRSSRDARRGSYGNWPRTDTQWVQYDWSKPVSTKEIEVYWLLEGTRRLVGMPLRRSVELHQPGHPALPIPP